MKKIKIRRKILKSARTPAIFFPNTLMNAFGWDIGMYVEVTVSEKEIRIRKINPEEEKKEPPISEYLSRSKTISELI